LIDIDARYLAGERKRPCVVRIADAGVGLFFGKKEGGYPWDQVRQISFDDPGRTKANVGAIAAFGVLGMASRQAFTLITVSTDHEELHFENGQPIGQWRAAARRIVETVPAAAGRIYVDGELAGAPATRSAGWYPDPLGLPRLRWHDGASWTDHTAEAPAAPTQRP
jgi:Protein of unknown function (DUF2510)